MRRLVLAFNVLFWLFGCGGSGGGGGGGPTTPGEPPDIAGSWSGTETTEIRGGDCGDLAAGTRTAAPIFSVTQNRAQIEIFLFGNCSLCEFTGTIAADGSFTATGTGQTATVPLVGEVSGNQMTAMRGPPRGITCDAVSHYVLTRG